MSILGRLPVAILLSLAVSPNNTCFAESRPSPKSYIPRCLLIVQCKVEVRETADDYLIDYKVVEVLTGEYNPLKFEPQPPTGYLYRTQTQTKKAQSRPVDGQERIFFFSGNGISLGKLFRHDDSLPLEDGKMNWARGRESLAPPELYTIAELKKLIADVEKKPAPTVKP